MLTCVAILSNLFLLEGLLHDTGCVSRGCAGVAAHSVCDVVDRLVVELHQVVGDGGDVFVGLDLSKARFVLINLGQIVAKLHSFMGWELGDLVGDLSKLHHIRV